MAENVSQSTDPNTGEFILIPGTERAATFAAHAPQLDDFIFVAVHRQSVNGAVADHATAVARERTAAVQERWNEVAVTLGRKNDLRTNAENLWRGRRAVLAVMGEGFLGGARNVAAAVQARQEIIASNDPYAMQLSRYKEERADYASDWVVARQSITRRMEHAAADESDMLTGERLKAGRGEGDAERELRRITTDLLHNVLAREIREGVYYNNDDITEWMRTDIRQKLDKQAYEDLFGQDASAVVITDRICAAKATLHAHLQAAGITSPAKIRVFIEEAIQKAGS